MCTPVAASYGCTIVSTRGETNELPAPFTVRPDDFAVALAATKTAAATAATPTAARAMMRFTFLLLSWVPAVASRRSFGAWAKARCRSGDGLVNALIWL